jgi:hypothetical protein
MTQIPDFGIQTLEGATEGQIPPPAPEIKHNWLYSVVPLFPQEGISGGIYLVAYCKNDRKYATVRLRDDVLTDFVVLGDANIPVYGCKGEF